jgi:hypothetical protein
VNFQNLLTLRPPPPNRVGKSDSDHEHHLYEGAVMLAFAMHLLRTGSTSEVHIHPDGEHGKQFDFVTQLAKFGFVQTSSTGKTNYGGTYSDGAGRTVAVILRPGLGDVVATVEGTKIIAECKGGIVNTRHAGQTSRLRKHLYEVVGMLMARPREGRQIGVVPFTPDTQKVAQRLAQRCAGAGIEIALVTGDAQVIDVKATT